MSRSALAAAGAAAVLAGCASTDYGTRAAGERPDDLSTTEASFWYQMDEAEDRLRSSGRLYEDAELDAYLSEVICRVAAEFCEDVRLYVLRQPAFNASMAPNGMALINTGMLLRVENESQLAFVLGHEFVHFEENHLIEQHADNSNATVAAAVLGTVVSVGVAASTGVAPGSGYSGSAASITATLSYGGAYAFSRERETEADVKGLDRAWAAGYPPAAGAEIWRLFVAELEASDNEAAWRRERRGGMFRSHPRIMERIDELETQAASYAASAPSPQDDYRARIRPHLKTWLDDMIVLRDFGASLHLIDRLSKQEEDLGVLYYARARTLAMRNEEGDRAAALEWYEASAEYPDAPGETFRGLGELYRAAGDDAAAADAFERYIAIAPDARDAAFIERLITDLRG